MSGKDLASTAKLNDKLIENFARTVQRVTQQSVEELRLLDTESLLANHGD